MADDAIPVGHNFEAVLSEFEARMREATTDQNFKEAARLRDEVKHLRATELAVVDDPTIKQRGWRRGPARMAAYASTATRRTCRRRQRAANARRRRGQSS